MATAAIFLVAYFASVAASVYAVFSPFRPRLKVKPVHGGRFQLADIFAIFIPIQFGFAGLNTVLADVRWYPLLAVLVATVFLLAVLLVWIYGLRILSRINVNNAAKRIVLLGVVMPIGLIISATSFLIVTLAESIEQSLVRLALISATLIALRWLGLWVLSEDSKIPLTPAVSDWDDQ